MNRFGESRICYHIHVVYVNTRRHNLHGRNGAMGLSVPLRRVLSFSRCIGRMNELGFLVRISSNIPSKSHHGQRHRPPCLPRARQKFVQNIVA